MPARVSTWIRFGFGPRYAACSDYRVLERVVRHDPVIRIYSVDEDRWVRRSVANVVIERIGAQDAEILFPVRIAIVIQPMTPDDEPVEGQHVHAPNTGVGGGEQVRVLVEASDQFCFICELIRTSQ